MRINRAQGETALGGDLFRRKPLLEQLKGEQDCTACFFFGAGAFTGTGLNGLNVDANGSARVQRRFAARGELEGRVFAADLFDIAVLQELIENRFEVGFANACEL